MPGPLPKPAAHRRRRNATGPTTRLPAGGYDGPVPPLPGRNRYLKRTLEWYAVWSRSPQAVLFTPTEWSALHLLAPLIDKFHRDPTAGLAAEIRLSLERLGGSPVARRRLG